MNDKLFDKRVARRNIDQGLVSQKDYDNYLSNLPDLTDKSALVDVSLYPSTDEAAGRPDGGGRKSPQ
jgi:hypothetical protein